MEALVAAYRADLVATGQFAENEVTSPARSFFLRVGVEGWSRLSLAEQCSISGHDSRLVLWLITTGRLRPTAEYLVRSGYDALADCKGQDLSSSLVQAEDSRRQPSATTTSARFRGDRAAGTAGRSRSCEIAGR